MTAHRHTWRAVLFDGRWIEVCICGIPARPARMSRLGVPIALKALGSK
jgi:hypothetical protein